MKTGAKGSGKPGEYPAPRGTVFTIREAKAHFSALIERATAGEEITITWHGQPKARLAPVRTVQARLRVDRKWLASMPVRESGPRADVLIRQDRDDRG
jgi:prevent-host-death family protein